MRYYFTIQPMCPNSDALPRASPGGTWLPPKARGNNLRTGSRLVYRHNGGQTVPLQNLPPDVQTYGTYSLYYCDGYLWTLPDDATSVRVGDGDESQQSSDSGDEEDDNQQDYVNDWTELGFRTVGEDARSRTSRARAGQESRQLLVQRTQPRWAHYLLPDRYRKVPARADTRSTRLVGDLALLIGIVAMSLGFQQIAVYLPLVIANTWRLPDRVEEEVPRASQWVQRAGMVVEVFYRPDETNKSELQAYEHGRYGAIFS